MWMCAGAERSHKGGYGSPSGSYSPWGGRISESYDALLLSPGAQPLRPPIPGIDHERIVTLRNVPDAAVLKKLAGNYPQGRAVVVGGGESAGPGPVRDIGGSSTPYSGSF